MFELSVACKYLLPKKRSLSTALISFLSVAVISLVIWLVILFLSITKGIETSWLHKLTSLHAPIRITPKENYYNSYYYLIDRLCAASDYSYKTIREKATSIHSNPYDPKIDSELPDYLPSPMYQEDLLFLDPVKSLVGVLENLQSHYSDFQFEDFEMASALLRLEIPSTHQVSAISQMSYLLSYSEQNPHFDALIVEGSALPLKETFKTVPVLLAKHFQQQGISLGSQGTLGFFIPSVSAVQEQKMAIEVVGFYDPGLLPTGSKCVILPQKALSAMGSQQNIPSDVLPSNGFFLWVQDLQKTKELKGLIQEHLKAEKIDSFWKVETFEDFDFSKDLFQQFQSDRTLFLLIASLILIVATSNIISLLTLLVHDKKKEIAILQAMGASFKQVAFIFGFTGFFIGCLSCLIGTGLAVLSLYNLSSIIYWLSLLQGHPIFNPAFFGGELPQVMSSEALWFVFFVTPFLALLSGLIPAMKAAKTPLAQTLRAE